MKNFKIIATLSENELKTIESFDLQGVDVFEIRLDLFSRSFIKTKLESYLSKLKKPILFTYRLPEDSSVKFHTALNVKEVELILKKFNSSKNYIDMDLKEENSFFHSLDNLKYKRIYSLHNFSGTYTYEEMLYQIQKINSPNAIYKFAVLPNSFLEGMEFLFSIQKLSNHYQVIGVWMGEMGSFVRIFGDMFGSCFTYATLTEPKAPGQLKVDFITKVRKSFKIKSA